jgi:hypothetical protein
MRRSDMLFWRVDKLIALYEEFVNSIYKQKDIRESPLNDYKPLTLNLYTFDLF